MRKPLLVSSLALFAIIAVALSWFLHADALPASPVSNRSDKTVDAKVATRKALQDKQPGIRRDSTNSSNANIVDLFGFSERESEWISEQKRVEHRSILIGKIVKVKPIRSLSGLSRIHLLARTGIWIPGDQGYSINGPVKRMSCDPERLGDGRIVGLEPEELKIGDVHALVVERGIFGRYRVRCIGAKIPGFQDTSLTSLRGMAKEVLGDTQYAVLEGRVVAANDLPKAVGGEKSVGQLVDIEASVIHQTLSMSSTWRAGYRFRAMNWIKQGDGMGNVSGLGFMAVGEAWVLVLREQPLSFEVVGGYSAPK